MAENDNCGVLEKVTFGQNLNLEITVGFCDQSDRDRGKNSHKLSHAIKRREIEVEKNCTILQNVLFLTSHFSGRTSVRGRESELLLLRKK